MFYRLTRCIAIHACLCGPILKIPYLYWTDRSIFSQKHLLHRLKNQRNHGSRRSFIQARFDERPQAGHGAHQIASQRIEIGMRRHFTFRLSPLERGSKHVSETVQTLSHWLREDGIPLTQLAG